MDKLRQSIKGTEKELKAMQKKANELRTEFWQFMQAKLAKGRQGKHPIVYDPAIYLPFIHATIEGDTRKHYARFVKYCKTKGKPCPSRDTFKRMKK
jgi:hypothetical protein